MNKSINPGVCTLVNEQMVSYENKLGLKGKSSSRMLEKLKLAKQDWQQETEDFQSKGYLAFADAKGVVNTVMNEVRRFSKEEEEEKMQEAILLCEKGKLLDRLMKETQGLNPVFNYLAYQQSDNNPAFYLLNQQPLGVTNGDYDLMNGSQAQLQSLCVWRETEKLIKGFIAALQGGATYKEEAQKELQRLRKLLDPQSRMSVYEFFALLKRLKGMDPVILPAKEKEFYLAFVKFLQKPPHYGRWSPQVLEQSLQDIEEGKLPLCPLFVRALIRYEGWLNHLVAGLFTLNDHPEQTYGRLYDQTMVEGTALGNRLIEQIQADWQTSNLPADEYEKFIYRQLDKIKVIGDRLTESDYYHYLPDSDTVKCCFVNNCLDRNNTEFHQKELAAAVQVEMVFSYLEHELAVMGKEIQADGENLLTNWRDATFVIAYMLPNTHIVEGLGAAFERAMKDGRNRKPFIFILEDLTADFNKLFEEAEENLTEMFEEQPYAALLVYALNITRVIGLLEYKAQTRGGSFNSFYLRLKQFLSIQISFLTSHHLGGLLQSPEKAKERNLEAKVMRIAIKLTKRLGFLCEPDMAESFAKFIMAKDFSQFKFQFHVGCKSNELKMIIELLMVYNRNIRWHKMEGIFISKRGITLSAHTIRNNSYENLNTKHAILNIFKEEE